MTLRRIWDLRRGDDDDNRMSPQASGLRGMILSAALEFNFALLYEGVHFQVS